MSALQIAPAEDLASLRAETQRLRTLLDRAVEQLAAVTEAAGYFPPSQTLVERVAELREQSEQLEDLGDEGAPTLLDQVEDDLVSAQDRLERIRSALNHARPKR